MSAGDLAAFRVTFMLAAWTVALLLLVGTPLAWWLAHTRSRLRPLVEAVVAMPLVLPPTVLGFYLLLLLGANGVIGGTLAALGGRPLAFTFEGLVVGSVVYSLPFVVQPLQNSFAAVGRAPLEAAATLRAGRWDRFFTVAVPLAGRGFLTGATLGFAHTVGEFGVVLMIGGSLPGETRVVSIAIYEHVEALDYAHAHAVSGILVAVSFLMLCVVYLANRRFQIAYSP